MHAFFPVFRPGLAVAGLLLTAPFACAAASSGTAALTTDYVWRGTSQSNENPAVQAGIRHAHAGSGLYAQAWGSSVEFAPGTHASTEIDLVAGWSGGLTDTLALDVSLTRYLYPSTTVDLDWSEAAASLTWREHYWLLVGHSNDALASGAAGTYAQIGMRVPLSDSLRFEAAAGRYRLAEATGYHDYSHLQASAIWTMQRPFELRLSVHDTDRAAERGFGALAGSRVEAALQAAF